MGERLPPLDHWLANAHRMLPAAPTERDWRRFQLKHHAIMRRHEEWYMSHCRIPLLNGLCQYISPDDIQNSNNQSGIIQSHGNIEKILQKFAADFFTDLSPSDQYQMYYFLLRLGVFFSNGSPPINPGVLQALHAELAEWEDGSAALLYRFGRLSRHELVGNPPNVNGYIESLTTQMRLMRQNLNDQDGFKFGFGGLIASKTLHDISGQPSNFQIVFSNGAHEAHGGFAFSIYEQDGPPFLRGHEMMRLEFRITANRQLQIITIQGTNKHEVIQVGFDGDSDDSWAKGRKSFMFMKDRKDKILDQIFEDPNYKTSEYAKLRKSPNPYQAAIYVANQAVKMQADDFKTLTGGISAQDYLFMQVLRFAESQGISQISGVRDSAQIARRDAVETGKAGGQFYDLIFKRWRFDSPNPEDSFWNFTMPEDVDAYLATTLTRSQRPKDWKHESPPNPAISAGIAQQKSNWQSGWIWVNQEKVDKHHHSDWEELAESQDYNRAWFGAPA